MICIHLIHSLIHFASIDFDTLLCSQIFLHRLVLVSVNIGITFAKLAANNIKFLVDQIF